VRKRLAVVITACLALGVGAAAVQVVRANEAGPPEATQARTGALRSDAQGGCVAEYHRDTLDDQHWAADVTVTKLDTEPRMSTVTVKVNRWYRGGSGESTNVLMPSPRRSEDAPPDYDVGTRLLLSGARTPDGYLAWSCGFSRYYDKQTAATWDDVFS
jgi:hypothetical protein